MAMAATTPVFRPLARVHHDVALELVDDHFPVMLMRWVGDLKAQQVLRMIRFFDMAVERAMDEGQRLVHICDARDASLPEPLVRDMLVDWLSGRSAEEREVILASYVIAADPLIRGVIASLRWATGRGGGICVVPSLEQAVAHACEALEQAGMEVPDVLRMA